MSLFMHVEREIERERERAPIRMERVNKLIVAEGFARVLSMALASAAAIIIGLDAETKEVIFIERRAYVKDLPALWYVCSSKNIFVSFVDGEGLHNTINSEYLFLFFFNFILLIARVATIVAAVAAGYQFVQVCRCLVLAWVVKKTCKDSKFLLWVCLLFDQVSF